MLYQSPPPLFEVFRVWEQLEFGNHDLHQSSLAHLRLSGLLPQFSPLTATLKSMILYLSYVYCSHSSGPLSSVSLWMPQEQGLVNQAISRSSHVPGTNRYPVYFCFWLTEWMKKGSPWGHGTYHHLRKTFLPHFRGPLPQVTWVSWGLGSHRSVLSNMVATCGYLHSHWFRLNSIAVPQSH